MNITFFIGNGFDRNLGLNTTYSDFVAHYKKTKPTTEVLKKFHLHIKENEELWSAAEIAMGEYTSEFEKGAAVAFSECHADFCIHLASYLKEQERRIDYEANLDAVLSAFSNMNLITRNFPTQERTALDEIIKKHNNENTKFNFICFNYTRTLDECINCVSNSPENLGKHKYGSTVHNHELGEICHVHGTVDKEMVFGVNDESQIAKRDIFDCEDGDLYENLLIKVQANASYLENTDYKARLLLQNSHIIYVYGMSIGDTDKLWWDRICTWMNANPDRHLIVQKYDMPTKEVLPIKFQYAERQARREITKHSSLDATKKTAIEARIHITGDNIFAPIKQIATIVSDDNPKIELSYLDVINGMTASAV